MQPHPPSFSRVIARVRLCQRSMYNVVSQLLKHGYSVVFREGTLLKIDQFRSIGRNVPRERR